MLTDKERKELFEKKKYYREHPEESRKAYLRRDDGYVPRAVPPKDQKKNA